MCAVPGMEGLGWGEGEKRRSEPMLLQGMDTPVVGSLLSRGMVQSGYTCACVDF